MVQATNARLPGEVALDPSARMDQATQLRELPRARGAKRSSRRLLPLLAIPGMLVVWYVVPWLRHIPADAPLVAIAHRGGPGTSGAPEGTLDAFRSSVDAGADWLEFDVRTTLDGILIVLHDDTVDRTTNGSGSISNLTFQQVRALDAGGGAQIPTAEEVIVLAKRAGVPILPEIKDGPRHPDVARALLELLRANDYAQETVIQALEAETLVSLQEMAPEIRTCWITGTWQFDIAHPPADAPYVCPMAEMVLLNPDSIGRAHEAGRKVFAWWAAGETPVANWILEAYGVDGLIVDDLRSVRWR